MSVLHLSGDSVSEESMLFALDSAAVKLLGTSVVVLGAKLPNTFVVASAVAFASVLLETMAVETEGVNFA